ncbi:MAG: hypothetical protein JW902_14620 [Syntrophaceae bacterium]|nr:hypothetical protein [Syntrophaceae bacterium]
MEFWEKIKKDVKKGFRDGLAVIREGAVAVKEKAGELTEEGKRQYKLFDLKTKVQKEIAELGGKVYGLISLEKDPVADAKVKTCVTKIKKLETQITKLEAKPIAKPKAKAKIPAKPKTKKMAKPAAKATTKPAAKSKVKPVKAAAKKTITAKK